MFIVCVVCHKVVEEVNPLNYTVRHTFCEKCYFEAIREYINVMNELYFEEQMVIKNGES